MNETCRPIRKTGMALKGRPNVVRAAVVSLGLTFGAILSVITLDHWFLLKSLPHYQQESLYAVEVQLVENNMPIESSMLVLEKQQSSKNTNLNSICAPCLPLLW
jgi:hypothetical protein